MVFLWFSYGFPMDITHPPEGRPCFFAGAKGRLRGMVSADADGSGLRRHLPTAPSATGGGMVPQKKLTGAFYVGNRWVAGSCWDEKMIVSNCGSFPKIPY